MKEYVALINNNLTYFRYNKQHIIPLEEVKLQSLEDEAQYKNGWLICTKGKSFAVYAATATEKQEWMAHIDKVFKIYSAIRFDGRFQQIDHFFHLSSLKYFITFSQCIRDLLEKSGKKPAMNHAAVWVPDTEAPCCMLCKTVKFSVMERRVSRLF